MQPKQQITVVYNKFCPFAQRALLVALEKEVPAHFRSVSLANFEPFFKNTYAKAIGRDPTKEAKVPILIHNDLVLAESEIVCEYLAQNFKTGASLIPSDPKQKVRMRGFITHAVNGVVDLFIRVKKKQYESIESFREEARNLLKYFDKEIVGPYILGESISLADLLVYPWFERWVIIEHYFNVSIGPEYVKLQQWILRMQERSSVKQTRRMTTDEYYINRSSKTFTPKL